MKIISKKDQPLTTWSGGTTRQIYIFPEDSNYAERNFKIRVSTATVEVEKSVFTALPGYYRQLMVLEGELRLEHKDQHTTLLKKFDSDSFLGEWETTSYGTAIDFNAISVEQYDTRLAAYNVQAAEETLDFGEFPGQVGFYLNSGELRVIREGETHILSAGDFILLEAEECRYNTIIFQNTEPIEIVEVTIEKLF